MEMASHVKVVPNMADLIRLSEETITVALNKPSNVKRKKKKIWKWLVIIAHLLLIKL